MRLIDADVLATKLCSNDCPTCHIYCDGIDRMDVQLIIEQMPTVDPIKHGSWRYNPFYDKYNCTNCQTCSINTYDYCPNCGAKMNI